MDRRNDIAQKHRELLNELKRAYRGDSLTGTVPRIACPFAEGIRVRIEEWNGRWWFVYEPYTWVDLPSANNMEALSPPGKNYKHSDSTFNKPNWKRDIRFPVSSSHEYPDSTFSTSHLKTVAADWRRERWARRYNSIWHDIIAAWAKLVAPESETNLSAHHFWGTGVNAEFRVSCITAWSSPATKRVEKTL